MDTSCVVWAKMRLCRYWPAIMIQDPPEEVKKKGQTGQICVFFFGTKNFGYVNSDMMKSYIDSGYRKRYTKKRSPEFANAMERCDEFVLDPIKFASNAKPAEEEISIQLPLEVKEEPDIENDRFYSVKNIEINAKILTEPSTSSVVKREHPGQSSNEDYEQTFNDVGTQLRDIIIQFERCGSQLKSLSSKTSTERYFKEIDDLKIRLSDKNAQYEQLLMAKQQNEKEIEESGTKIKNLVNRIDEISTQNNDLKMTKRDYESSLKTTIEKYDLKILDIENKLREKSTHNDQLVIVKRAAEEKIRKMSSDYESSLNTSTARYDTEIHNLKTQLIEKNSQYNELLVAKQRAEKDIEQDLTEKFNLKILEIEKKLREKSTHNDQLVIFKREAEEKIIKMSSDYESSLKTTTARYDTEIHNIKSHLIEKTSQYDELFVAKQKAEKDIEEKLVGKYESKILDIEQNLTEKYDFKILDIENKLREKSTQNEKLAIAKRAAEGKIMKMSSDYESSLETTTARYINEIQDLNTKLSEKNSQYDELLVAKQRAEKDIEQDLTEKFNLKILEIEKKLREKSTHNDQLVIVKRAAEEKIIKMSSDYESSLKTTTARYDTEIQNIKSHLSEKTSQFDELFVAKQKAEKDIEEKLVGKYESKILGIEQDLTGKYDLKILDIGNKLREKSTQNEELVIAKQAAEEKIIKMSSDYESSLETTTARYINEIQDLNTKLSEKNSQYDELLVAKQKAEKDIEQDLTGKYDSKILNIENKLRKKSAEYDKLVAAKEKAEVEIKKSLSSEYEMEIYDCKSKLFEKSAQCDEFFKFEKTKGWNITSKAGTSTDAENSTNISTCAQKRKSQIECSSSKKIKKTHSSKIGCTDRKSKKVYEVQSLLDHKIENNERFFLIRWEGFAAKFDSWEHESNLSCPEILEEYEKTHNLVRS